MASVLKTLIISCLVWVWPLHAEEAWQDPTQPAFLFSKDAESKFELQGVFIAPDRHSAVINGKYLGLGDTVDGERVITICRDRVITLGAYGKREVFLHPGVDLGLSASENKCKTVAETDPG